MLRDFMASNREEILARARERVAERASPAATDVELTQGLPMFFEQLLEALGNVSSTVSVDAVVNHVEIQDTARKPGAALFRQGLTVAQVVRDYGDICQVIMALAVERKSPIAAYEFQAFNLCLDDAIAGAVTEYSKQREKHASNEGTERIGTLAHEMRNLLNSAMLSFASIKRGVVATGGSTSATLERSLLRLQALIDYSLADVRLEAGLQNLELIPLWEVISEVEVGAELLAQTRGLRLVVTSVDAGVIVKADRQILAAAIANLLQNAFKFTRPDTSVHLTAHATPTHVLIDVADECGGLVGAAADLLKPFVQMGRDRTGLGLGLSICQKAVTAIDGELRIVDVPGKGCVFTIDLPRRSPLTS
jgi:signal transduction histidine kinase